MDVSLPIHESALQKLDSVTRFVEHRNWKSWGHRRRNQGWLQRRSSRKQIRGVIWITDVKRHAKLLLGTGGDVQECLKRKQVEFQIHKVSKFLIFNVNNAVSKSWFVAVGVCVFVNKVKRIYRCECVLLEAVRRLAVSAARVVAVCSLFLLPKKQKMTHESQNSHYDKPSTSLCMLMIKYLEKRLRCRKTHLLFAKRLFFPKSLHSGAAPLTPAERRVPTHLVKHRKHHQPLRTPSLLFTLGATVSDL